MTDSDGPHLATALVCERVLQEQDGVVSAIRIIDRVHFTVGDDGSLVQPQQPVTLLITFKSGAARGRYTVRLRMEKPSGEEVPMLEAPVFFEGEERGVNMILGTLFAPDQEGLYWFDVIFETARVTRIPLRAIYQPLPRAGPAG